MHVAVRRKMGGGCVRGVGNGVVDGPRQAIDVYRGWGRMFFMRLLSQSVQPFVIQWASGWHFAYHSIHERRGPNVVNKPQLLRHGARSARTLTLGEQLTTPGFTVTTLLAFTP